MLQQVPRFIFYCLVLSQLAVSIHAIDISPFLSQLDSSHIQTPNDNFLLNFWFSNSVKSPTVANLQISKSDIHILLISRDSKPSCKDESYNIF